MKEPGVTPPGTKGAKGSAARASQFGLNNRPPVYKVYDDLRNRRSVWTVGTKPFNGAHFATFPPDLIARCIIAGSRPFDTMLDPFSGAGTSGLVADQLERSAALCERQPSYVRMANKGLRYWLSAVEHLADKLEAPDAAPGRLKAAVDADAP